MEKKVEKVEFVYDMAAGLKAAAIARKYLGQQEISGNQGFLNKTFEKMMRAIGFYTGAPWCGFFARLVWKEAGLNFLFISPSSKKQVDASAKGKKMEGNWHTIPVVGAIAVWANFKKGKRQSQGHFSVVERLYEKDGKSMFDTIDGNSNSKGGREGNEVTFRYHTLDDRIWNKTDGRRLLGFIYPTAMKGSIDLGPIGESKTEDNGAE